MNINEICSFYVSEAHLLTKILPYINEKMNVGKRPIIITENDLTQDVKKYLKLVKNFDVNREKLLSLSWKKKCEGNVSFLNQEIVIIGEKEFIDKKKKELENTKMCNVLSCYKIKKLKEVETIIYDYDICLNTNGIQKILKNSQNAQKRKTIKSQ